MHTSFIVTPALAAVSAIAHPTSNIDDAEEVMNNPPGAKYVAMFKGNSSCSVTGTVVATSGAGGDGVDFSVRVMNLPPNSGPFCASPNQGAMFSCDFRES
jgi:hypothetical protein